MAFDKDLIDQIDIRVKEYNDFFSDCIFSLRETNTSNDHNPNDDIMIRAKFNEGIVCYTSKQFDRASEIFSEILEKWIRHVARPESKDMADTLFYFYPGKSTFSERIQFRLNLIFKIHDISDSRSSQRIEIAERLHNSYLTRN